MIYNQIYMNDCTIRSFANFCVRNLHIIFFAYEIIFHHLAKTLLHFLIDNFNICLLTTEAMSTQKGEYFYRFVRQPPDHLFCKNCHLHSKFKWINSTSIGKFKLQTFLLK